MKRYTIISLEFNSKKKVIELPPPNHGDKSYTLFSTAYESLSRSPKRTFLIEFEEIEQKDSNG